MILDAGYKGFGMFELGRVGIFIALAGIVYPPHIYDTAWHKWKAHSVPTPLEKYPPVSTAGLYW